MHTLGMIGQILIGLFFVYMGLYNLKNRSHLIEKVKLQYPTIPEWALFVLVVLEIAAGVAIVFDFVTIIGAIYLIAFTILATLLLHPFWTATGRDMWKHLSIVVNNVAIIGGLLLIIAMMM